MVGVNGESTRFKVLPGKMHRVLHGLLISSCTGIFVYQAYQNIDIYIKYPTTRTNSKTTLSHVGLPRVEVCLKYGFDTEFLKLQGYGGGGLVGYVTGSANDSFIGWRGNGSLSVEELRESAYVWKKSEDILDGVTTYDPRNGWLPVELKEVGMRIPAGKCFTLNKNQIKLVPKENFLVSLVFNDTDNNGVTISITDPHTLSWKVNFFSNSGDKIDKDIGRKEGTQKHFAETYDIRVSETVDLEEDVESGCRDYSLSPFGSYTHCMMTTAQQYFRDRLNCVPPVFLGGVEPEVCGKLPNATDLFDPMIIYSKFLERSTLEVLKETRMFCRWL